MPGATRLAALESQHPIVPARPGAPTRPTAIITPQLDPLELSARVTFEAQGLGLSVGQIFRAHASTALIALATRIGGGTTAFNSTHTYLRGGVNQAVFDNVRYPARVWGGVAVYETSVPARVLSYERLPSGTTVIVRYQDVSERNAPNVNLPAFCRGAIRQGNDQRTIPFWLPFGFMPKFIAGKSGQLSVYIPQFADQKAALLGCRLRVVPA